MVFASRPHTTLGFFHGAGQGEEESQLPRTSGSFSGKDTALVSGNTNAGSVWDTDL